MDYININNPAEYKDMYIYRPILDMEYDEKYSISSACCALLKLSVAIMAMLSDASINPLRWSTKAV